jgi:hypothetical protein
MKFRKKPIIIEAEQWFHGKEIDGVENCSCQPELCYIETKEGKMYVSEGDWIITGVEGEIYCCKDSIFRKTYELVEETIV